MTMGRLGGAINRLATGTFTITRPAASSYVNGRAASGAPSTFQIVAVLVPLTGRELMSLPEGERSKERIAFLTRSQEIRTTSAGGATSDVITYKGVAYEIEKVETWDAGEYWRCVARKVPL